MIYKNGSKIEDIFGGEFTPPTSANSYTFILDLNVGDTVEIFTKFNAYSSIQPGIFYGYRVH